MGEILARLESETLVKPSGEKYHVTNLGAVLFARDLRDFGGLDRKAVRVIVYQAGNRVDTTTSIDGRRGYAAGFQGLVKYVQRWVPESTEIKQALRTDVPMYPPIAIRELVANALIHQDFNVTGAGPKVEIFKNRLEIMNPGTPLVEIGRLDLAPRSRNETLSGLMRRLNICEEQGSGIQRVLLAAEMYQLPPPDFRVQADHTKVVLSAPKTFAQMTKGQRVRACYQHASLQFATDKQMTNATLRKRFMLSDKNRATASTIISDTLQADLIRPFDPSSRSRRHAKYVPYWAS